MKILFKIFLVGIGVLLLLGGGVCAATSVLTLVTGGLHSEFSPISLIALGICVVAAGFGLFLVKVGSAAEPASEVEPKAPAEDRRKPNDHDQDAGPGPFKP